MGISNFLIKHRQKLTIGSLVVILVISVFFNGVLSTQLKNIGSLAKNSNQPKAGPEVIKETTTNDELERDLAFVPKTLTYQIGDFVFTTDTRFVYEYLFSTKEKAQVFRSKVYKEGQDVDPDWPLHSFVGGLEGFFNYIRIPDQEPNGSPGLAVDAWNTNSLEFKDQATEVAFRRQLEYFQNLQTYTNHQALLNKLFDPQANFTLNVSNFYGGSGIFSYPLLVQVLPQSRFDAVYFAEIISGNGNLESPPSRVLIINERDSWIIIEEQPYYDITEGLMEHCYEIPYNTDTTRDKLRCVEKAWREKHRDAIENQRWAEEMLSKVTYSPKS